MSNSKQRPYEQENYPASPEIIYYDNRKFNYTVIQEGVYPPVAQLKFTEAPNYFPVPDNYIIKTTWGRSNNCQTIQCSIYYIEGNPHYLICFGNNFQHQVVSVQSTFDASVELHNIITPNKKTAVSGVHLYGLQLKCIDRNRKSKLWALKLHDESSKTTQIRHAKEIDAHMEQLIPINFVDLTPTITPDFSEEPDITDPIIVEQVNSAIEFLSSVFESTKENGIINKSNICKLINCIICNKLRCIFSKNALIRMLNKLLNWSSLNSAIGKDAYRSIKKILKYIVPAYIQNEKLDPASPIIHLRISALLDDSAKLFEPNYHYTVVLFPGIENYSTLKIAADTLIRELQELSTLIGSFLPPAWVLNVVNSNYFCPWCEIAKNQRGDRQTEWIISKKMSILNENPKAYPGHHSPPLFNMIPLDHYVPDKLHIMLRITDQIETLKIRFEFWKICDTDNWCYTFLMGNDKLCVLRKFNLTKLFDPERAALIRSLWNGFAELYDLLGERETNPHYFRLKAKE
ncbi:hypothetical protein RhiirB3_447780 [Rhizophagus irregularis]|nr:hypothetical protein RhiirB3_447780 [Rhizophagus irregularis]